MSMHLEQSAVTVLGLGPMGRALAGAFLEAGLRTTVWNRTPAGTATCSPGSVRRPLGGGGRRRLPADRGLRGELRRGGRRPAA